MPHCWAQTFEINHEESDNNHEEEGTPKAFGGRKEKEENLS
jgi:hypothetical protein